MAFPCDQCQALAINGVNCHETGCPDAWQDTPHYCGWCGAQFAPEERGQQSCDDHCHAALYDLPCTCDDCNQQRDDLDACQLGDDSAQIIFSDS